VDGAEHSLPHPPAPICLRACPNSPVAWQKRWKVPSACTCCAWSLRRGGSKVTRVLLSGPEPKSGQGLQGEEDEPGPRQDREEEPGGGKGLGDEAVRQRGQKRKGTEEEVVRNASHARAGETQQEMDRQG
jgi:hypothetical protein